MEWRYCNGTIKVMLALLVLFISLERFRWLKELLEQSKMADEKVIVASHHPIGEGSARLTHSAWNYSQITSILLESGVVHLVLSGHDHKGGYNKLQNTHFLTLHSVLEGTPCVNIKQCKNCAISSIG